jgi:Mor family transcriptional regulator
VALPQDDKHTTLFAIFSHPLCHSQLSFVFMLLFRVDQVLLAMCQCKGLQAIGAQHMAPHMLAQYAENAKGAGVS